MNPYKRGGLLAALTALAAAIAIAIPVLSANVPRTSAPASAPTSSPQADPPVSSGSGSGSAGTTPSTRIPGVSIPPLDTLLPRITPPGSQNPWRWPWEPNPGNPGNPGTPGTVPVSDPTTPPGSTPTGPGSPPTTPSPVPTTPDPTPTGTPTDPPTDPPVDPPAPTGPATIVSLTFDDGTAGQTAAASILAAHGYPGTFYVNSGTIGLGGYLTQDDLHTIAGEGHEIGGHTVTHPDLTVLPADEVTRQICDDRSELLSWGFAVRSFAYPFASVNNAAEQTAQACGYNSARGLGDIESRFGCAECGYSEGIPPADPYYVRALDEFDSTWTLQDLQNSVTAAEAVGGWLPFTFHDICTTSCGELSISQSLLSEFLDWMNARAASHNTTVKTVGDVIGGAVAPAVAGPAVPPPTQGGNGVKNPGLEELAGNDLPSCWYPASYGNGTSAYSLVSPGRTGVYASRITMSNYVDGDAKILPTFDLGACAPSVVPGESYSLRAWYSSTTVTQFAVYLRTTQGGWVYWTSSPWFGAASDWTQAAWTTPTIPAGYNGISFGLNIFSDGVLTTDDYGMYDVNGAPPLEPPAPAAPAAVAAPAAAVADPAATPVTPVTPATSGTDPAESTQAEPPAADVPAAATPAEPPAPVPDPPAAESSAPPAPVPADPPTPAAEPPAARQESPPAPASAPTPATPAQ